MGNQVSFTPYEIKDCLMDVERTENLKAAIFATVKSGDVILEAGGGTGILSFFALQAGAKHAYIIELSPRFCDVIRDIAAMNGYEDKITVICGDATCTDIPIRVDVYISELLCTGLFNEPQIQAYNNLRRFTKSTTKYIPTSIESQIKFVEADTRKYGLRIDCDSYLAEDISHTDMTESQTYMTIKFDGKEIKELINYESAALLLQPGEVNAAVISTTAMLNKTIKAEKTKFLFNPELIFLDIYKIIDNTNNLYEPMDFQINYNCGCDTKDIDINVW